MTKGIWFAPTLSKLQSPQARKHMEVAAQVESKIPVKGSMAKAASNEIQKPVDAGKSPKKG